jgi:pimeloyl-ACP methyl ester carboxylesterase
VHVSLVGHSLGGLFARYYAQELDRVGVVDRVLTLATPYYGAPAANALPTGLARAMRPGSEVLRRLHASRASAPPTYSLLAADDHLVMVSETAAALEGSEVRVLEDIGHNGVLYDLRAHDWVVDALVR